MTLEVPSQNVIPWQNDKVELLQAKLKVVQRHIVHMQDSVLARYWSDLLKCFNYAEFVSDPSPGFMCTTFPKAWLFKRRFDPLEKEMRVVSEVQNLHVPDISSERNVRDITFKKWKDEFIAEMSVSYSWMIADDLRYVQTNWFGGHAITNMWKYLNDLFASIEQFDEQFITEEYMFWTQVPLDVAVIENWQNLKDAALSIPIELENQIAERLRSLDPPTVPVVTPSAGSPENPEVTVRTEILLSILDGNPDLQLPKCRRAKLLEIANSNSRIKHELGTNYVINWEHFKYAIKKRKALKEKTAEK